MGCIAAARRGIIVVGQMTRAEEAAAALKIAEALGWPLVADVLSGIPTSSVYWAREQLQQCEDLAVSAVWLSGPCRSSPFLS